MITYYTVCMNCKHETSQPVNLCPKCGEHEYLYDLPYEEKRRDI